MSGIFATTFHYRNAEIMIGLSGYGRWKVRGVFNDRLDAQVQLHWTNAETIDDLKGQSDRKRQSAQKRLYESLLWDYHKLYGRVLPHTRAETPIVLNGLTVPC